MQEQLTVNDKNGFGPTYFKGKKKLTPESDITLNIFTLFFPLQATKQFLLSLSLLFIGLLPFLTPDALALYPRFPEIPPILAVINVCLVPLHLVFRHYLIRRQYGFVPPLLCRISNERLSLPPHNVKSEAHQQLKLSKSDIRQIEIIYAVNSKSNDLNGSSGIINSERTIYQMHIHLTSKEIVSLDGVHYPLKNIFYLLTYFNYPIKVIHKQWSLRYQLRVILLIWPALAHLALTCLMVIIVSPWQL